MMSMSDIKTSFQSMVSILCVAILAGFFTEASAQWHWAVPGNGVIEFVLYATDAIGNRDSVRIIRHVDATCEIDEAFGETTISAPFDSVLDLRVRQEFASGFEHRKTFAIGNYTFDPMRQDCSRSASIFLSVYAKNSPITFSWSRQTFRRSPWAGGSYITNDGSPFVAYPYDKFTRPYADSMGHDWAFMADDTSIAFRTDTIVDKQRIVSVPYEVEGKGEVLIPGFYINLGYIDPLAGPCCPIHRYTSVGETRIDGASLMSTVDGMAVAEGLPAGDYAFTWYLMDGRTVSSGPLRSAGPEDRHFIDAPATAVGAMVLRIHELSSGRAISGFVVARGQ